MKTLICLITLIGSLCTVAAQDLRGNWTGRIYQGAAGAFELDLRIKSRTAEGYEGTAYCKSLWGPYPGRVLYKVQIQETEAGEYRYEDLAVLREEKEDAFFWCMKVASLRLLRTDDSWSLSGKWEAEGCLSGTLYANKAPEPPDSLPPTPIVLENRQVSTRHEFAISTDSITIEVWDNNEVDGDIISLNVNGKWLLRHYALTQEHWKISLPLVRKETLLILHAENLGSIPPNTAAISIHDGQRFRSVVLNSDKQRSEAIRIVHGD